MVGVRWCILAGLLLAPSCALNHAPADSSKVARDASGDLSDQGSLDAPLTDAPSLDVSSEDARSPSDDVTVDVLASDLPTELGADAPPSDVLAVDSVVVDGMSDVEGDSGTPDVTARDASPDVDAAVADASLPDADASVVDASDAIVAIDVIVGPCGAMGQQCCAGSTCNTGLGCAQLPTDPMATCRACGGNNAACCAGSTCMNPTTRRCFQQPTDLTPFCRDCGGNGQYCCAGDACPSGRVCQLRPTELVPRCRDCGGSGQPCCEGRVCMGSSRRCTLLAGNQWETCE